MSERITSQANTTAMRKCMSRWHLDSFRFGLRIVVTVHCGVLPRAEFFFDCSIQKGNDSVL